MNPDVVNNLENAIDQAIAQGELDRARERLTELLPLPVETPPELACRIELMFAEVLVRIGQAPLARGRLIRAAMYADALAANPLVKLRELRIRLWLGQVERLGEELSVCDRALQENGDLASRVLLSFEEGRAWDATGRLDRAGECWARAEEWSRSLETDTLRADLLIKLGRLEHLRGNNQGALERYDVAIACAVFQPQRQEAVLRRLRVLLDLGRTEQVRAAWEQALDGQPLDQLTEELQPLAQTVRALIEPTHESGGSGNMTQERRLLRAACRRLNSAGVFRLLETEYSGELHAFGGPQLPVRTELGELERALPPGTVYLAPVLAQDEFYLLACRRGGQAQVVRGQGSAYHLAELVNAIRRYIDGPLGRHRNGHSPSPEGRAEIDHLLDAIGKSCLGNALGNVLDQGGPTAERIIWVPDGVLHGFPLHSLRRNGRYLIETYEVAYTLSGSLLAHQLHAPVRRRFPTRALGAVRISDRTAHGGAGRRGSRRHLLEKPGVAWRGRQPGRAAAVSRRGVGGPSCRSGLPGRRTAGSGECPVAPRRNLGYGGVARRRSTVCRWSRYALGAPPREHRWPDARRSAL